MGTGSLTRAVFASVTGKAGLMLLGFVQLVKVSVETGPQAQ